MLYLYLIEVKLTNKIVHIVTMAENEEKAFTELDAQLQMHYIRTPEIVEAAILQKKRTGAGAFFIVDPEDTHGV